MTPGNAVCQVVIDNNGNGNGSFQGPPSAGSYILVNLEGYGTSTTFTVTGGLPTKPTITITGSNNVTSGGTIAFQVLNFEPNGYVNVYTSTGYSIGSVATNSTGDGQGTLVILDNPGPCELDATDGQGNAAFVDFTVVGNSLVTFQVFLAKGLGYMVSNGTLVDVGGVAPTGWTCRYWDPVTSQWTTSSSMSLTSGVSFSNVNPGGYIAVMFSSNPSTGWLQGPVFTAQNNDIWYANPYYFLTGQLGGMSLTNTQTSALTIANPSNASIPFVVKGGVLSFSLANFTSGVNVFVGVVGGGGITVITNYLGQAQGSFIDNDSPATYVLEATDNYGDSAKASFQVLSQGSY
jgi:hypothetical protein